MKKAKPYGREFRKKGHEAFSSDILDCSGGHPEWHIKIEIIKEGWDMMIAFPPCTHLAVSGARHFAKKIADGRQQAAKEFFMKMIKAPIDKIAPPYYEKPTQIIQISTCLWLQNLRNQKI